MKTLAGRGVVGVVAAAGIFGCGLVACVTDYEAPPGPGTGEATWFADAGEDTGSFGDGAPSASPELAKLDTNASMTQTPGQGVGVFAQYDSGGHWYVWWTCDTNISHDACAFSIQATVAGGGGITDAMAQGFAPTDTLTGGGAALGNGFSSATTTSASSSGTTSIATGGGGSGSSSAGSTSVVIGVPSVGASPSWTATTTTTTTVEGVHFNTAPGAIVTLSAALGGQYSGAFLFFVQDNTVNGGYTGLLSDPLELQPSTP